MAFFFLQRGSDCWLQILSSEKPQTRRHETALLTSVFSVYFKFTLLIALDLCWLEDPESAFMKNTVFFILSYKGGI